MKPIKIGKKNNKGGRKKKELEGVTMTKVHHMNKWM
jgi:hypothetical protein